jgi:hypothetical protein
MAETLARHRQPWKSEEIQKLHRLAARVMGFKTIAKALTCTEETVQERPRGDCVRIAKLR